MTNNYDNVDISEAQLLGSSFKSRGGNRNVRSVFGIVWRKINFYCLAMTQASGLRNYLLDTGLINGWFNDFRVYWMKELMLCRIELHDFYYLHGVYRSRFQSLEIPADEEDNDEVFMRVWQKPEVIYLLFAYCIKLARHPIAIWSLRRYVKKGDSICEYGCGVAPVVGNLARYYPDLKLKLTGIDIPTILLHFARWSLQDYQNVSIQELDSADDNPLNEKFNMITCLTVFEHLPRPLKIAEHMHQQLKPGGYLVFDYISSDGAKLDTTTSMKERGAVLEFIANNFKIVRGVIPTGGSSVKRVVCRKQVSSH